MNEGHNVIKSNFDRSPARRMMFVFLFLCKRKFSCTKAPVGLFFSDVMVRKKYLFVEPLDIFAFIISNKIIQLSCGRIFLPSLPTRLSIIDLWGMDCLFTPNCPIGEAKRLTSQNSGCQQFGTEVIVEKCSSTVYM